MDLFSSVRINDATVDRIEAAAPWGLRVSPSENVRFILVLDGCLHLQLRNHSQAVAMRAGSLSFLFGGQGFSLADQLKSRTVAYEDLKEGQSTGVLHIGSDRPSTIFVCGHFVSDPLEAQPIFHALPSALHLHLDHGLCHSFQSLVALVSSETRQPGLASAEMIDSLCGLLMIHAIRAYAKEERNDCKGWLAGLGDPQLAQAIHAVHEHLGRHWTVEAMASAAGMSRSGFALKFRKIVGQSPLEYLTQWRIHQAALMLRKSGLPVATIARRVGYRSESAFAKVFKRVQDMTPSEFLSRAVPR